VTAGWPPAILTPVTKLERDHGRGQHCIRFIESFGRITKDSVGGRSGELIVARPFQRALLRNLLAAQVNGRYKHRQGIIGLPRKQGKSSIMSGVALYSLVTGPGGGEVYMVAGTKDQAKIVFGAAKRMIEMDPHISKIANLFRDAVEIPKTGSVMRPLAADAPHLEGLNPSLVVADEVHVWPDRDLWDVLALAGGARVEPLMVAITTAGKRTDTRGDDSLAYRLYQYAVQVANGSIEDPTFFGAWWQPKDPISADHTDPVIWKQANPGFGDLIDPADFEAAVRRTPELEFRTKRLNMWVDHTSQWIPIDAWSNRAVPGVKTDPDAQYVLGVDASFSGDSTAIVACSVSPAPTLHLIDLWERPDNVEDRQWRVNPLDIEASVERFCRSHSVVEVAYDPYRMQRSAAVLLDQGLPMVEFPQSPARLVPATSAFYEAVMTGGLSHPGDPNLTRHILNASVKNDPRGVKITKSAFTKKIDAAVASVMAFGRAQWHQQQPPRKKRRGYGF